MKEGAAGSMMVRADTLPLVFPVLGAQNLPRGAQVRVKLGAIDEITLDVTGTLLERLDDTGADQNQADVESPEDEEEAVAGPIAIAVDMSDNPETFNRVFEDMPLEVILVNAQTKEAPDKAQAVAQSNLAGGGESANTQERASSPLPYSAITNMGDDFEQRQRQVDAMQQQQMQLLAELRNQLAQYKPPDLRKATTSQADIEQEEKHKQLLKMLAEIEKRINEENARPKKRYISPATREEVYALYYDALRRKVEERGTSNFPEAGGKSYYGAVMIPEGEPTRPRAGHRSVQIIGQPAA
ncbi:hypothetical protein FQA39_LY19249 [Lamprigera yunnana]|nr:hypothetical protein FQA39_LY19249 [Lamprigera yunnana]